MIRYWEIIANNLSKAGWSWGYVATVDCHGQTIFVADAHRANGKRHVVRGDELLTAFLELESAIRGSHSFPHPFTGKKHSSLGEKKFQKPLVINSASCACAFFSASLVIPPL